MQPTSTNSPFDKQHLRTARYALTATAPFLLQGFFTALRLVAVCQNGKEPSLSNLSSSDPLPQLSTTPSPAAASVLATAKPWVIDADDRKQFVTMFNVRAWVAPASLVCSLYLVRVTSSTGLVVCCKSCIELVMHVGMKPFKSSGAQIQIVNILTIPHIPILVLHRSNPVQPRLSLPAAQHRSVCGVTVCICERHFSTSSLSLTWRQLLLL